MYIHLFPLLTQGLYISELDTICLNRKCGTWAFFWAKRMWYTYLNISFSTDTTSAQSWNFCLHIWSSSVCPPTPSSPMEPPLFSCLLCSLTVQRKEPPLHPAVSQENGASSKHLEFRRAEGLLYPQSQRWKPWRKTEELQRGECGSEGREERFPPAAGSLLMDGFIYLVLSRLLGTCWALYTSEHVCPLMLGATFISLNSVLEPHPRVLQWHGFSYMRG